MRPLAILAAAALIGVAPAHATDWWLLYRSDPSTGIMDACKQAGSPSEGFAVMAAMGFFPEVKEVDGGVFIFATKGKFSSLGFSFYRSREGCETAAQANVDELSKYQ